VPPERGCLRLKQVAGPGAPEENQRLSAQRVNMLAIIAINTRGKPAFFISRGCWSSLIEYDLGHL
jgi:hypothetical protein